MGQRELETLRKENLTLKMKNMEGSKRMLSALMGSQASLLIKGCFTAWRDDLGELRRQRELETLRKDNLTLKMKNMEGSKRMLSALMGSQGSLLIKGCFTAWRDDLGELRRQRELETLRKD